MLCFFVVLVVLPFHAKCFKPAGICKQACNHINVLPLSSRRITFTLSGSVISEIQESFKLASNKKWNNASLTKWDEYVKSCSAELRWLGAAELLEAYQSLLTTASATLLDPLQKTTFSIITTSIMDALLNQHPKNTPITSLIDEITDLHLTFIDNYKNIVDTSKENE